ncbi:MAG: hypothetical protein ABSE17_00075 [Candidatus Levyibacteriota bacterium]
MGKDKQVEGEWPLYPNPEETEGINTHPDAGTPGRDHSREVEQSRRAFGRRRQTKGAHKPIWSKGPDAPRALPLERERKTFAIRIEQGVVVVVKGLDYTLGPRRIDIWTPIMDPEQRRLDWIEDVTVIVLGAKPKGKKIPHDARTDAYIVDKPPARGEIKDAILFNNGLRDAARVSVFWEDIQAKPAKARSTS